VQAQRIVVHYRGGKAGDPASHEWQTRDWLAKRLADLLGYAAGGEYDPGRKYPGRLYFVPSDTLLEREAEALGIATEADLFGGVVPHPFLTTKSIAHPLVDEGHSPPGWSHLLGRKTSDTVLHGYTAFTRGDARKAALRVMDSSGARLKEGLGIGGRGQTVVGSEAELDAALEALEPETLLSHGIVVEQNLTDVTTYSVGRVTVGGIVATYTGTQRLTASNHGAEVYGGSTLTVARGDFDALLQLDLPGDFRLAVDLARSFDAAVSKAYPRLLASRRNYDVAQGRDAKDRLHIGVLEQSWRAGGASPAEMAALAEFRKRPDIAWARTSCVEVYGKAPKLPPDAAVVFSGIDPKVGPLTKYVVVEAHGRKD
jgi:hypothetical protein